MNISLMTKYEVVDELIKELHTQIKPQATGHIRTAISVLEAEKEKIRSQIEDKIAI